MKKIDVSVISPIYKVPENLLRNNIEHLIKQSLKEIEIILVDDGSPDDCGKICDEYAERDKRIKVIHQKNKGLCGARNTGQKNATGEYIMFLDGDDYLELDALEKMYLLTKEKKYDVISACIMKDYGTKVYNYSYSKIEANKAYLGEECRYWQKLVLDFNANISAVYAKLYNRSFLEKNNLYHDEQLRQGAEGLEFLIRVFGKANSIIHINEYLHHYMYNDTSITQKHNEQNHKMVLNCFDKIYEEIVDSTNAEELKNQFYDRLQYVIVTTAISGFFSPTNKENYFIQKMKYKKYLENNLIKETLNRIDYSKLSNARKLILFLIKAKMFFILKIFAIARYYQKQFK